MPTAYAFTPERSIIVRAVLTRGALPGFAMVGVPNRHERETRDRVRAALLNQGYQWPGCRITLDVTADYDAGAETDSLIAAAIVVASEQEPGDGDRFSHAEIPAGVLTLAGHVQPPAAWPRSRSRFVRADR